MTPLWFWNVAKADMGAWAPVYYNFGAYMWSPGNVDHVPTWPWRFSHWLRIG
jgi:hypothetical protein